MDNVYKTKAVLLILSFICMFCRSLFVLFLLVIVLSVLQFTDSDYPFVINKLFVNSYGQQLHRYQQNEQSTLTSNH